MNLKRLVWTFGVHRAQVCTADVWRLNIASITKRSTSKWSLKSALFPFDILNTIMGWFSVLAFHFNAVRPVPICPSFKGLSRIFAGSTMLLSATADAVAPTSARPTANATQEILICEAFVGYWWFSLKRYHIFFKMAIYNSQNNLAPRELRPSYWICQFHQTWLISRLLLPVIIKPWRWFWGTKLLLCYSNSTLCYSITSDRITGK